MLINERDLRRLIKNIIKEAKNKDFEKDDEGNYVSKTTAIEGLTKEMPEDLGRFADGRFSFLLKINSTYNYICNKYKTKLHDEEIVKLPITIESDIFNFFRTKEGEMCIKLYIGWKKEGSKEDYLANVKRIEKLSKVDELDAKKEREKQEGLYSLVWDIIHYFVHKAYLENKKSSKD